MEVESSMSPLRSILLVDDFVGDVTLCRPLMASGAVREGKENDRRLSPPVCWLIYCSPTTSMGNQCRAFSALSM